MHSGTVSNQAKLSFWEIQVYTRCKNLNYWMSMLPWKCGQTTWQMTFVVYNCKLQFEQMCLCLPLKLIKKQHTALLSLNNLHKLSLSMILPFLWLKSLFFGNLATSRRKRGCKRGSGKLIESHYLKSAVRFLKLKFVLISIRQRCIHDL